MTSATNRKRGFTFIELLVILVIIGIATSAALPRLRPAFENLSAETFIKDIYYLCRYLQESSCSTQKIYMLSIDTATGQIQALQLKDEETKPVTGRFGKIYKIPENSKLTLEPGEKNRVYFYPNSSTDMITVTLTSRSGSTFSLELKGDNGAIQIK